MAKCSLDIRKDIIDEAGAIMVSKGATVSGNVGYFANPALASKAISDVNRYFKDIVVKGGEKGSFFIDPSESLVKEYLDEYNKSGLALLERDARLFQEGEIARGGYTEEEGLGEFYQVTSEEIEQADKKLDGYLLDFLKPFGVTSKEVESLKRD